MLEQIILKKELKHGGLICECIHDKCNMPVCLFTKSFTKFFFADGANIYGNLRRLLSIINSLIEMLTKRKH